MATALPTDHHVATPLALRAEYLRLLTEQQVMVPQLLGAAARIEEVEAHLELITDSMKEMLAALTGSASPLLVPSRPRRWTSRG